MSGRAPDEDRGSIAVETAVIAPALVFLMLLVVYAGRVSHLDASVQRASSEASRAASLEGTAEAAQQAATEAAQANLDSTSTPCTDLAVEVDTTDFRPGGYVTATVRCGASMSDVALLGVPGTRTFTASSSEVIDRFRGGTP
ncbi:MAG TPA: TadE family protein [Acidimicrobiia bacterium]|nr:TadE family protein [Acidimicrobiia bacterium]